MSSMFDTNITKILVFFQSKFLQAAKTHAQIMRKSYFIPVCLKLQAQVVFSSEAPIKLAKLSKNVCFSSDHFKN